MARVRHTGRTLLKVLLALAVSWLAVECLLFVFNDRVFSRSPNIYDPDLGFKIRPGYAWNGVVSNAFGFNDRDYPLERRPGTYRVVILADSFNWAGGADNFTHVLERRLAARFGPGRVEVINAGYPGSHTGDQLAVLEKYGLAYRPDLVVLGFFVGNDFYDADRWQRLVAVGPALVHINVAHGRERALFGQPLVPSSRLRLWWQTTRTEAAWLRARRQAEAAEQPPQADASSGALPPGGPRGGPPAPYAFTPQYREIMSTRMQIVGPAWRGGLEVRKDFAFHNLKAMSDLLGARDIDFVVLAYPDEFQVDEAQRRSLVDQLALDVTGYEWDLPQALLAAFCDKNHIAFHDLLPAFRAAHAAGTRLYLLNDSHWNAAGNALAAREIGRILEPRVRAFFGAR